MICCKIHHTQGHNEARWRPWQETNLASRVRTWCLSEPNALYWRKYLWHCWDFSSPPCSDSAPGELCLFALLRYASDHTWILV